MDGMNGTRQFGLAALSMQEVAQNHNIMTHFHILRTALAAALFAFGTSCADLGPAGTLGMIVNGEHRLRPPPENYRDVPPLMEQRAPLLFKTTF
jgi:hypothetical protein